MRAVRFPPTRRLLSSRGCGKDRYRLSVRARRATSDTASRPRPKITSEPGSEWLAGASRFDAPVVIVTKDAPAMRVDVTARFNIRVDP
jgi:hypothetical protein